MKKFEDIENTGPLAKFLDACKPHRIEAIYNTEYRFIKEIVWDTEAEEKFGTDRAAYEAWSKTDKGYERGALDMSYSGKVDLRVLTERSSGKPVAYVTETKLDRNKSQELMHQQFELAKEEVYKILNVANLSSFNYWFEEQNIYDWRGGANEIISSIEHLELIIKKYNKDEEFRSFIDKIKV